MTLRTQVMLSFVLVVALSLGSSGFFFLKYFEDSFRRTTFDSLESIALARAESISNYLRSQLSAARHIGRMIPKDALKAGEYKRVEEMLNRVMRDFPVFENGFFILSASGELLVDYPPYPGKRGMNFGYRSYFKATMKAKTGIVGQPYRSARSGKAVLTFTAYLTDENGKPLGVLGCSAQLLAESALGHLRQQKIGKTGYSYVYDHSRLMILHPRDDRVLTRDVPVGANKMFDAALGGFTGAVETVNSKGIKMLTAYHPIPSSDWIIGCQQTAAEAFSALQTTRQQILFFVVTGSIVAALIGILLVHRSTAVLVTLERVTADLSVPDSHEQDLDLEIANETRKLEPFLTHPEFGPLADTIRKLYARLGIALAESREMTVDLQQAYAQLKQTQAQIFQQEKMASIGQLAAGVAHEINNPMGFITSNLGALTKYQVKLFGYQQQLESWLAESATEALAQQIGQERKRLK
ncbi:MAG: Cache 3/Cache 2 fusion domain-containing protein, partial [Geopsychrobacter sp.]|nr:Cache 3/Cache 2 fusion domain-containing protein [Geopsychrobacter sp.]